MDKIAEVFDIEPFDFKAKRHDLAVIESESVAADAEEDFDFARTNIKNSIEKASDALEDMLELARASENSRAYEVFANLANSIAGMSEQLVKIHEKRAKPASNVPAGGVVNNNSLIVSSTEDIIRMLKEKHQE